MMVIYFSNILIAPLALLVWLIDMFVLLLGLRIILGHIPTARNSPLFRSLQNVTDPPVNAIHSFLFRLHLFSAPSWVPWLLLGIGCFLVRNLLAGMLISLTG